MNFQTRQSSPAANLWQTYGNHQSLMKCEKNDAASLEISEHIQFANWNFRVILGLNWGQQWKDWGVKTQEKWGDVVYGRYHSPICSFSRHWAWFNTPPKSGAFFGWSHHLWIPLFFSKGSYIYHATIGEFLTIFNWEFSGDNLLAWLLEALL